MSLLEIACKENFGHLFASIISIFVRPEGPVMKKIINSIIRPLINALGIEVLRYRKYPCDFNETHTRVWEAVKPYTMTTLTRVGVLVDAVRYLVANNVEGDFVECGVWKGGSAMAMAMALQECGEKTREIYLYDTYSGMTAPSALDVFYNGRNATEMFSESKTSDDTSNWCFSPLEEVQRNVRSTGYPEEKLHFIEGKVEETIPRTMPKKIALLRLDTDWYASTKHEMVHLFPLLAKNGILIIDDYACWEGAKKAVDEYISENSLEIFLVRIDSEARVAIKSW